MTSRDVRFGAASGGEADIQSAIAGTRGSRPELPVELQ
jgi:hypothetical protein